MLMMDIFTLKMVGLYWKPAGQLGLCLRASQILPPYPLRMGLPTGIFAPQCSQRSSQWMASGPPPFLGLASSLLPKSTRPPISVGGVALSRDEGSPTRPFPIRHRYLHALTVTVTVIVTVTTTTTRCCMALILGWALLAPVFLVGLRPPSPSRGPSNDDHDEDGRAKED